MRYSFSPSVAVAIIMTMVNGCTSVCCIGGRLHKYISMIPYAKLDMITAIVSIVNEMGSGGRGVNRQRIEYIITTTLVTSIES